MDPAFYHIYLRPSEQYIAKHIEPVAGLNVHQLVQQSISARFNQALDWIQYGPFEWVIYTNSIERAWYDRLLEFVKPDGNLFICKLDIASRHGWMPAGFWEWLDKNQFRNPPPDEPFEITAQDYHLQVPLRKKVAEVAQLLPGIRGNVGMLRDMLLDLANYFTLLRDQAVSRTWKWSLGAFSRTMNEFLDRKVGSSQEERYRFFDEVGRTLTSYQEMFSTSPSIAEYGDPSNFMTVGPTELARNMDIVVELRQQLQRFLSEELGPIRQSADVIALKPRMANLAKVIAGLATKGNTSWFMQVIGRFAAHVQAYASKVVVESKEVDYFEGAIQIVARYLRWLSSV